MGKRQKRDNAMDKHSRGRAAKSAVVPAPKHSELTAGSAARLLNRELGILAFQDRVLALAADPHVPPLERLRKRPIFCHSQCFPPIPNFLSAQTRKA